MAAYQSLENVLFVQTKKLQDLETATDLIKSKDAINEDLLSIHEDVCFISKGIQELKDDIILMKQENECLQKLLSDLKVLDHQIKHMEENIPLKIQEYVNSEVPKNKDSPPKNKTNIKNTLNNTTEYSNNTFNGNNTITDMKSCKKVLFNEPDIPQISLITEEEFAKIPKYIISRHTLETLNNLVCNINQIIKSKYTLIALGDHKNGRKKVELDLYLQYKKEQASLGKEEEQTYFFTPADFERIIKAKLDKTKLNLIIALRHCKRLREFRTAKNVHYALIVSNF